MKRLPVLIAIFVTLFASLVFAQNSVLVSFEVKDVSGAVVSGAEVSIAEVSQKAPTRAVLHTDAKGLASLRLTPGIYELSVKMLGFRTVIKRLAITEEDRQTFAVALQVASCPPGPCLEVHQTKP